MLDRTIMQSVPYYQIEDDIFAIDILRKNYKSIADLPHIKY